MSRTLVFGIGVVVCVLAVQSPAGASSQKLFWDDEEALPTEHDRILMVKNSRLDIAGFKKDISQLEKTVNDGDSTKIMEKLTQISTAHLGKISDFVSLAEETEDKGS